LLLRDEGGSALWLPGCLKSSNVGHRARIERRLPGGNMLYLTQDYSDLVTRRVEDLASRVHLLKNRFAQQTVSVQLEHYWELSNLRTLFCEFKWRIEQLDEDDDFQLKRDEEALESNWNQLMRAVDVLLTALA
jgi:hypothetical protein